MNPDQLMDSKLKCVFELPTEGTTNAVPQENDTNMFVVEDKVKKEIKSSPKVHSIFSSLLT